MLVEVIIHWELGLDCYCGRLGLLVDGVLGLPEILASVVGSWILLLFSSVTLV